MGKGEIEEKVIEISASSSPEKEKEKEKKGTMFSPSSSSSSTGSGSGSGSGIGEDTGTPIRPIFCLKKNIDMKRFEEIEDCFILDFDPFESIDITNLSLTKTNDDDDDDDANDISVIAQKGQVACRDYPHSRHLCLKFPFATTPHHNHCELCYCYVCDSVAPCKYWTDPISSHCHASDNVGDWNFQRALTKNQAASLH